MKNKHYSLAPALSRGLEVLDTLTRDPNGMTLAELSAKLHIPPASLWRISRVLMEKGFVVFDNNKRTYRLGLKLMSMGDALVSDGHLKNLAREDLRKLATETGETVELAVRIRDELVIIDQVPGPGEVYLSSHPGGIISYLHATAPGKIYLAQLERKNLRRIIDRIGLHKLTKNTIDSIERLEKELEQVSVSGYAIDMEEMKEGVSSAAAPVYGNSGVIKACVAVVCPAYKLKRKTWKVHYGEKVKEAASEMTEKYGGKI